MPRPIVRPDKNIRGLLSWELAGFVFLTAGGSIFHFVYQWFGPSQILAAFFPVNESVWEHLKLSYWSLVLFSVFESLFMRWRTSNFWWAKGLGLVTMHGAILAIFYTYTSILGYHIVALDIISYIIGAFICQSTSFFILARSHPSRPLNRFGAWILILHGLVLVLFTFATPRLPIFMDGRTGTYGIP